ncbi:hypothetical protein EMIHUDRAFT_451970 [Emiliania huxleyi CCMP1516]|uniref:Methyltransferase domain-containing protein n=2 Tax=Emiliania huxleyi TaxID=2903 RepID=A0A0D3IQI7_EMIH1|nr:hypothetical protein EMIHUDRAFT_451970 [Emiliania huxleyi CCMP1516]EOD13522.1 hypothetical protein EMIHUDRAFT_451970 [Emiliania huxleyi CCMP1516]|eukprot:XP_005765951.1 hypothetical protein EMIHUDRAFT_451970 [Emiliania huxleyi CCMP1516]
MCRSTCAPLRLLTLALAGLSHGRPSDAACPPSCPVNELSKLYDQYCSDKGTFWQSKHHYASAYHQIFGSIRNVVTSILEIGIGEDTAPSVASWLIYFPKAHIYPIDIKTTEEVAKRAVPGGATDRVVAHQAKFGCEYNRPLLSLSLPRRPSPPPAQVHLTLNTDASDPAQLSRVRLPPQLDIILDDGSHRFLDQEKTLHVLWPRLRPGGFYIIEDILIGALPWDASHAQQAPTNNSDCGGECFFPQKIAEHPFLLDRFGHTKGGAWTRLRKETQELLRKHDWFFSVTGVHKGGGLDVSLILRKAGPAIGSEGLGGEARPLTPPLPVPQARSALQLAETQQKSLERQHSELQQSLRSIEQAVETRCTQQEAVRPADEGSSTVMYALLAASARGYRRVPNRAEGF